jgi:hypothetical protein
MMRPTSTRDFFRIRAAGKALSLPDLVEPLIELAHFFALLLDLLVEALDLDLCFSWACARILSWARLASMTEVHVFEIAAAASSGSATSPTLVISRSDQALAVLGEVRWPIRPHLAPRHLPRKHFASVAVTHHILPYVIVGRLQNTVEVKVTNFRFFFAHWSRLPHLPIHLLRYS